MYNKETLKIKKERASYVKKHYTLTECLNAYIAISKSKDFILVETANKSCNNEGFNKDTKNNLYPVKMCKIPMNAITESNLGWCTSSGKDLTGVAGFRLNISKSLWDYILNGETVCQHWQKVKAKAQSMWGYAAEFFVYKFYGMGHLWKRDSTPFEFKGDIVIDGIHYQIKTHQAVVTSLDRLYDKLIEMYGKRD